MSEKLPLLGAGLRDTLPVPVAQRGQQRWRRLHFAAVFAAAVLIYLYNLVDIVTSMGASKDTEQNLCLTPACVHASSEILYNLSPNYQNIDPCTNFEELVCGGWRQRHDLRPDQSAAFTGTLMHENSQLLLRRILEADYPHNSTHSYFSPMQLATSARSADEENFKKMKDAYNACLDEDTIKKRGVSPLMKVLDEVRDTFPTTASDDQIGNAILLLAQYGVSAFITAGTGADDRDPDTVVVQVYPPMTFGLPSKEYYEDASIVAKYQNVVVKVLSALFPGQDTASFKGVVELETQLADATPLLEDLADVTKTYNPMSLKEAAALAPSIGLVDIISNLAPSGETPSRVIVASPEYMESVGTIISETSPEVLQSFFLWRMVKRFVWAIEADEVKPYQRLLKELQGMDPDSEPERWRTCVGHVDSGLGWILSRFFVENAFSAKAKKFGDTIILDIKDEFTKKLQATEWMEESTTKLAIEKVHNIVQKIGYPTTSPDIMDPDALAKWYASFNVSSDDFFNNNANIGKLAVQENWNDLGKPVDRGAWGMTVPTVNAYYNPPGNEIVFPAGIMQFPVFDVNVPAYLSYGAFGSVAGHELSHAFDSTGRHYDQNGVYSDWWTNSTVEAFKKKAQCFVDQYSDFTVPGPDGKPLHVNGNLTLGENIADAGGLSASFLAWKRREAETPNDDLPGLDFFSHDQLFFVSYSNWWCGMSRKDEAISRIYTDPHAPKWARILGTMANSREFRESFHCKSKEPTCELW